MTDRTRFDLGDLERIISRRAGDDPQASYTARLIAAGTGQCAQKLGEEAVETVIAAMQGDREQVRKEAADLLFHLLVVLHGCKVTLGEVIEELATRTGRSGLEEKADRPRGRAGQQPPAGPGADPTGR